ncbi:DUF4267 domain-containing protein [Sabulicella rubraurantiaca]|uniref:DUF4267 domain-containing protein n=1 Tax=Sabulicella rubraurantiaca TaxID=2811429 RepID=UPI001A9720B0|nr:DUF4267 domain-containing protein [Sabulicella rubraurantiaca]
MSPAGPSRGTGRELIKRVPPSWGLLDGFALSPAVVLAALGVLFVVAPRAGAAVFGLPAPEGDALGYLRAIGIRDLAFGGYVLALAWLAGRRAAGIVLAITLLIPVSDLALILSIRGFDSPLHLLLHAASGIYVGLAAMILLRYGPERSSWR